MGLRTHLANLVTESKKSKDLKQQQQQELPEEKTTKKVNIDNNKEEFYYYFEVEKLKNKNRNATSCSDDGTTTTKYNLSWTTRLTIILIGTCILFSTFFALEFLIAKISSLSILAQSRETLKLLNNNNQTSCLASHPINWHQMVSNNFNQSSSLPPSKRSSRDLKAKPEITWPTTSKLGMNFDLIYESELQISKDQLYYVLPDKSRHLIRSDLTLKRLLEAYQSVMPFDPDIWTLSEPEKQMHLLSGNFEECTRDLEVILDKLEKIRSLSSSSSAGFENYKLMQLMDSFGRPEAGSLLAHTFWLGSYYECQKVSLTIPMPSETLLETRYCVGKLKFKSWSTDPGDKKKNIAATIKVGLCLPKSCDSMALFRQQQLAGNNADFIDKSLIETQFRAQVERIMLFNFNKRLYFEQEDDDQITTLNDIYCLPLEERRQLSTAAFLLLLFILIWLLLCACCTWLRRERLAGRRRRLMAREVSDKFLNLLAIDVNVERFFFSKETKDGGGANCKEEEEDAKMMIVNLNALDSVKHLGCMGVIAAHVLLAYLTLGTGYSHILENIGKDLRTMLMLSLNNNVDTFFVISGLLISYFTFKTTTTTTRRVGTLLSLSWLKNYLQLVARRYLRLGPLYFLVFAYSKSVAAHLGSGPLWDYATNHETLRGNCKHESWLWPLLFASDFKPLTHHCIPAAWSVAVDMQFFLILPIFIAILRWLPIKFGYTFLSLLIVTSTACTWSSYKSLLEYVSFADFAKLRLHVFTVMIRYAANAYNHPQNRAGPILVGLIGGHMLHEYERRAAGKRSATNSTVGNTAPTSTKKKEKKSSSNALWPWWMRGNYFRATLLLSLAFMMAPMIVQVRERAARNLKQQQQQQVPRDHVHSTTNIDTLDYYHSSFTRILLALGTTTEFDCYLALGGFILIKPLWSICNCIIFLRLITDLHSNSLLVRLMGLNWWRPLSKLNYSILLVHYEFIAYEAMSRQTLAPPLTWIQLICKFSFAYLGSLLISVPIYVLFEQPIYRLTNSWLKPSPDCQQQQESNQQLNTTMKLQNKHQPPEVEGPPPASCPRKSIPSSPTT